MEPPRAHQHRARSASFEPRLLLLSWAAASVPPTRSSESQCWGRGFGHGQSLSRAALPVAWDQGAAHPCSAGQGVTPSHHTEPPGQGLRAKPQSRTSKAPVSTRPPVSDLRVILSPGYGLHAEPGPRPLRPAVLSVLVRLGVSCPAPSALPSRPASAPHGQFHSRLPCPIVDSPLCSVETSPPTPVDFSRGPLSARMPLPHVPHPGGWTGPPISETRGLSAQSGPHTRQSCPAPHVRGTEHVPAGTHAERREPPRPPTPAACVGARTIQAVRAGASTAAPHHQPRSRHLPPKRVPSSEALTGEVLRTRLLGGATRLQGPSGEQLGDRGGQRLLCPPPGHGAAHSARGRQGHENTSK